MYISPTVLHASSCVRAEYLRAKVGDGPQFRRVGPRRGLAIGMPGKVFLAERSQVSLVGY